MPGDDLAKRVQKNEEEVQTLVESLGDMKSKVDQVPNIMTGINDIKTMITSFGERLSQVESDARVCRDVLRDLILDSRAKEYRAQVEAKLSRPATLVFSRPNGPDSIPPPTSTEAITDFITDKFQEDEAPDFVIKPMGKRGSYKLIPETHSPMEGRRICAAVLQAVKPSEKGKKPKQDDLKTRFGLNAFYDNPLFLGEIRSNALRFVAQMLSDQGIKLKEKPFVKREVMLLDGIPMFPEFLVPTDEALWPSAFPVIGDILCDPPADKSKLAPLALATMEDLFVAGKGLLFPRVLSSSPPRSRAPEPMHH